MKLNPFSKKPTAYYDKVKAKYDQLDHELTATKDQLNEAEADFERKRRRQFELDQHGSMYSSTREQSQASFAASEASNRVGHIKGEIDPDDDVLDYVGKQWIDRTGLDVARGLSRRDAAEFWALVDSLH